MGERRQGNRAGQAGKRAAANRATFVARDRSGGLQVQTLRARHFTQDRQDIFFARLAETCNVELSAEAAGTTAQTIWRWRRKDPEFAHRFATVRADAHADLEMRLIAVLRTGVTGEHWEEVGEDGVKRLRFRRDVPAQMRLLVEKHQLAMAAAATAEAEVDAERSARETLDELIDRLRDRLQAIRAEREDGSKDGGNDGES